MSATDACQEVQHPQPEINVPERPAELTFSVVPKTYFMRKALPERVIAALLLVPASPIIALLVVVVRLTSPGPAIYRQVRAGVNGKPFTMLKIRSMRCDAESGTGAVWTRENDPRMTLVGRVLRKFHLDEFPQLVNVMRGEMSLIGPRPERPEFVQVLEETVPGYINRMVVRPGITGLAQINLPPDSDVDSVKRKLELDLTYIDEAGPWLDSRMLFCTLFRVFGLPGNTVMRLFGVRRKCNGLDRIQHRPKNDVNRDDVVTPDKILASQFHRANHNGNGKHNGNRHHTPDASVKPSEGNTVSEPTANPQKPR